jgi:hypothetical protein
LIGKIEKPAGFFNVKGVHGLAQSIVHVVQVVGVHQMSFLL